MQANLQAAVDQENEDGNSRLAAKQVRTLSKWQCSCGIPLCVFSASRGHHPTESLTTCCLQAEADAVAAELQYTQQQLVSTELALDR